MAEALRKSLTREDGELILTRDEDGRLPDCAALVAIHKAWVEADDRIRIHRGKPLPGSLRPESKRKQTRTPRKSAPNGPISPAPPQLAVLEPPHNSPALQDSAQPVLTAPGAEVVK